MQESCPDHRSETSYVRVQNVVRTFFSQNRAPSRALSLSLPKIFFGVRRSMQEFASTGEPVDSIVF